MVRRLSASEGLDPLLCSAFPPRFAAKILARTLSPNYAVFHKSFGGRRKLGLNFICSQKFIAFFFLGDQNRNSFFASIRLNQGTAMWNGSFGIEMIWMEAPILPPSLWSEGSWGGPFVLSETRGFDSYQRAMASGVTRIVSSHSLELPELSSIARKCLRKRRCGPFAVFPEHQRTRRENFAKKLPQRSWMFLDVLN